MMKQVTCNTLYTIMHAGETEGTWTQCCSLSQFGYCCIRCIERRGGGGGALIYSPSSLYLSRDKLCTSNGKSSAVQGDAICSKDGLFAMFWYYAMLVPVSKQVKSPNPGFSTLYDEWLYYKPMSFNGTLQPQYAAVGLF